MSTKTLEVLKGELDRELFQRNRADEVSYEKPDPVLVARKYRDEWSALVCALFGYGRADLIVRFLDTLEFSLLDASEEAIRRELAGKYYRFQSTEDIVQCFVSLRRLKLESSLQLLFTEGYSRENDVLDGIRCILGKVSDINKYQSRGYRFLWSSVGKRASGASPLKRWMMFLRWMVRHDAIDLGLWQGVDKADLIIPLDTHTFNVSRTLGLLERKSYDLQAAKELTAMLRRFDPEDPVKYDFALYRLGQEKKV